MKIALSFALLIFSLHASPMILTTQQERDWKVSTQTPIIIDNVPFGHCLSEVVTPTDYLYAITLPFDAQTQSLNVSPFQQVQKGETLLTVRSSIWVEAQHNYIENLIAYRQQSLETQRQQKLCAEEIIPKKECTYAQNRLNSLKAQLASSKALLFTYGATNATLQQLTKTLSIEPTLLVKSPIKGTLIELNTHTGQAISADSALMMIQKSGPLWLEIAIPRLQAQKLNKGEVLNIQLNDKLFESTLLLHAPTINPQNQTQTIRFSLPDDPTLMVGLKAKATLFRGTPALKVAKKSLISDEAKQIVFIKTDQGYEAKEVTVISEDATSYYLKDEPILRNPIVTTSIAILKNMMESEDE
jgi:cobalt-zinc-cadmium efflux system membrane fusion protein